MDDESEKRKTGEEKTAADQDSRHARGAVLESAPLAHDCTVLAMIETSTAGVYEV
jgi:hypothetical protein